MIKALKDESKFQFDSDLKEECKRLAVETCAFLKSSGARVKPYTEGLPHFSKLILSQQEIVVQQLKFFRDLCAQQIQEKYSIKDNHSFVWRAMRALGIAPTSDLFNYITDENMIEIYSSEGFQLFRNFKFFEFCSYTLEDLYSVEWWNLYRRDADTFAQVIEISQSVNAGKSIGGLKPDIVPHSVEEMNSDEKLKIEISFDWIAPIFKNKQIAGCISISKIKICPY